MNEQNGRVDAYFMSLKAALSGFSTYLNQEDSPLYRHNLIGSVVAQYLARLNSSIKCWENRVEFVERFHISTGESGFPTFQNVLNLKNDADNAEKRLAELPSANELREQMINSILKQRKFPSSEQKQLAERFYLEQTKQNELFLPLVLPETIRVSVNPKTHKPYYVVHWGSYDGRKNLPVVYVATIEDSSKDLCDLLVTKKGSLRKSVDLDLPIGGLLNPELASKFDDFADKNSAYSLAPITIAKNMDEAFDALHPKQLYRFIFGPFYSSGVTQNQGRVNKILKSVTNAENAWVITWTIQEVFSLSQTPAKRGLWSSQPAREVYHLAADNPEAAQQGVSEYEKHALVPHEAYQAIYAAGEVEATFGDYKVHIISGNHVVSEV